MTNPIAPDLQPHAIPIGELHPWDANPNVGDLDAIERSLAKFGQRELGLWRTEVIDGEQRKVVYSGNHRLLVARDRLGWTHFAASCADDMTPDEIRAYAVATNRTRDLADTDEQAMADLLATLEDQPDLLDATGFDGTAIDELLESIQAAEPDNRIDGDPDDIPEPVEGDPVTKAGDVWLLGPHRLVCGDSTTDKDIPKYCAVITDPPYGVSERTMRGSAGRGGPVGGRSGIDKGAGRGNWVDARNFEPVHGDDEPFDPSPWLEYPKVVLFGANHYCDRLPPSPTWIVWDKLNGLETEKRDWGFDDNADNELAWTNLGGPARTFSHRWKGLLKDSERQEGRVHPTQKPVALFAWLIRRATKVGEVVLDPYAGSGACLMASEIEGRVSVSYEISPVYVDVICRRYQTATGTVPVLESSGESVSFV